MSNRSHSLNAYEVALTSAVGDSSLSFPVESVAGLSVPMYVVVDPDDPTKREYIKVVSINGNNLEVGSLANRGLAGTTGGVPLAHDLGAKIRAVAVAQWLDDIFGDIEELEIDSATHLTEAQANLLYVLETGDTMTGFLTLNADPTADLHATTKQYVDQNAWFPLVFSGGKGEAEETVAGEEFRWIAPRDCTLVSGTVSAGKAPTGSALICDARLNDVTMFTTLPEVADGEKDGVKQAASTTHISAGDVVTGLITQVGSTTPGENVTFALELLAI
jgi:hypothetical protein